MADEPKKETVRITPPRRPPDRPPGPPPGAGPTPPAPPAMPIESAAAISTESRGTPEAAASLGAIAFDQPAPVGPRKETARIRPSGSPMKATVRLSPIQPPSAPAAAVVRTASPAVKVAEAATPELVELVPMPLCWALLGISALVFVIQLWIYLS